MPQNRRTLDGTLGAILSRRESRNKLRRLSINPPGCVDFSSNGYLSLSTNKTVQETLISRLQAAVRDQHKESATSAAPTQSAALLGSGGSRLLDGNSSFAEELEARIAAFHGAEAGLLFGSAFDANAGLLGCVPQRDDVVLYDDAIHASVHDGMRLSRASKQIPVSHECLVLGSSGGDDAPNGEGLGRFLSQLLATDLKVRDGRANVFVCVEGLYSMDGDVVALRHVVDTVEHHLPLGNGYIIVDEAHSVGVFGEQGRGLVCELGLEDRIWARVLGFGKALGCSGGIVLCSQTTRSYLINYARTFIYTTGMSFPSLASIDVVYDYLSSGQADRHREQLKELIRATHRQFRDICARQKHPPHILRLGKTSSCSSSSPIIPLLTAHPRSLADHCQKSGFVVRPIVAPTVPAGSERVRICLHAGNTLEQVEAVGKTIEAWLQSFATRKLKSLL